MLKQGVFGFIAGFVATLTLHQGTIWLINQAGLNFPVSAWFMRPNAFGVPGVISLAFWAGVWGVLLVWLLIALPALPQRITGLLLGSFVPSVFGWTAIATMRGAPMFANGNGRVIALVLFVNAVWGWATVLLWQLMRDHYGSPASARLR